MSVCDHTNAYHQSITTIKIKTKKIIRKKVATFPIAQRGLRPCKPGLWNPRERKTPQLFLPNFFIVQFSSIYLPDFIIFNILHR